MINEQQTVADYIVQRLAREGITDCFGVAGDFAFKLCDAVARSEAIRWIGCSNELNAAYAADGYARVRGCSMLLTTYAVGELSALNGVMGARAERSCVFHMVGMPTMRHQRVRKIIHHTFGDGEFQNFANISAQAACVSAVITPDNCAYEMEPLIATARAESRPAYILVASDYAVTPVTGSGPAPYPMPASGPDLAKAVEAIAERIEAARSLAILPAYTVSRFKLQHGLRALIEALDCPFAAMAMDKGVLSEAHPQFVGIYAGAASSPSVLEAVEGADVVIDAGGVSSTTSTRRPTRAGFRPRGSYPSMSTTSASVTAFTTPYEWAMFLRCWQSRSEKASDTRRRPARPRRSRAASPTTRLRRRSCIRVIEAF
jgi:indolepyruvate decarboxylase